MHFFVLAAMLRSDKIAPLEIPIRSFEEKEEILKAETAYYDNKEHDIHFSVHQGEVVGFYGLVGSGRTECMEMIAGLRACEKSEIVYCGEKLKKLTAREAINKGIIMTPEKRANGMFKSSSLVENISTLFLSSKFSKKGGFVDFQSADRFAEEVLKKNKVKYSSKNQAISGLSGGNIQKIIIGRSIEVEGIRLMILDEPTAGMDVAAVKGSFKEMLENGVYKADLFSDL